MGHIHAAHGQYDFTASAMIVHNHKVLLLFHHKLHLWLPPAGHIELDEHPIEALYREVEEESGLTKEHLTMVLPYNANLSFERDPKQNLGLPVPFDIDVHAVDESGHRHIDLSYIFISDASAVRKEEGGAEQLEWFTLDQVRKLSPMPKKIYSLAEYAVAQAEEHYQ